MAALVQMDKADSVNEDKLTESTETAGSAGTDENLLEEEEEAFFQDIYLLTEHGISIEDIEALRQHGINTIKGAQMTMSANFRNINKTFTQEKIDRIKLACGKIALNNGFMTALELAEERKRVFRLPTGSLNLDQLLGGGIQSMSVTEVFGEARTGKTQLAHTLSVTAQLPGADGYSGGKVIFIDTEHTFRPERIRSIAKRYNLDQKTVLENILYARAYNSEHQYELLKNVCTRLHEEAGIFKLVIVDSIMATFRVDFCGRSELANRQQKLAQMMSRLQKMSEEYNIAVFITNQITGDLKFSLIEPEAPKPSGGNILAHASTTRIAFKMVAGNVRIAMLYDSPELEGREEAFILTAGGIKDPKND